MARKPEWRNSLEKIYFEMYDQLTKEFGKLPDHVLEDIRDKAPTELTSTNCWWYLYRSRELASELAVDELMRRNPPKG